MKAKIKKGVKPFGGKTKEVLEIKTAPDGKKTIIIEAGPRRGIFGYFSDPREYYEDEVELLG